MFAYPPHFTAFSQLNFLTHACTGIVEELHALNLKIDNKFDIIDTNFDSIGTKFDSLARTLSIKERMHPTFSYTAGKITVARDPEFRMNVLKAFGYGPEEVGLTGCMFSSCSPSVFHQEGCVDTHAHGVMVRKHS